MEINILTFATLNVAALIFLINCRYSINQYNPVPIYCLTNSLSKIQFKSFQTIISYNSILSQNPFCLLIIYHPFSYKYPKVYFGYSMVISYSHITSQTQLISQIRILSNNHSPFLSLYHIISQINSLSFIIIFPKNIQKTFTILKQFYI